jgi:hypothetical protein
MRKKDILHFFDLHCTAVRKRLIKRLMIEGLKEGLCPFRCRYCKKRGKNCQSCIVLELKETEDFKSCQEIIKRDPSILKKFIPILQKVPWREPNLRGGF